MAVFSSRRIFHWKLREQSFIVWESRPWLSLWRVYYLVYLITPWFNITTIKRLLIKPQISNFDIILSYFLSHLQKVYLSLVKVFILYFIPRPPIFSKNWNFGPLYFTRINCLWMGPQTRANPVLLWHQEKARHPSGCSIPWVYNTSGEHSPAQNWQCHHKWLPGNGNCKWPDLWTTVPGPILLKLLHSRGC